MLRVDKNIVNMANKVNVLRILWENENVFRAEIARTTGLSQPTVLKIIDEFKERGLVNITGKGVSSGGKPPLMLEFKWDAYYMIGVDIDEYHIEVMLLDLGFHVVDRRIQDNRAVDTSESILKRVVEEIKTIIEKHQESEKQILGIGVGIPGIVDAKSGIVVYSTELNWQNVNIKKYLKQFFEGEIFVDDSTRALAMEEKLFGNGKGVENFLCLYLASGIGSAMVMNGKLYYGSSEAAGQLGHMAVEREGARCSCGNFGCLELYASGKAIETEARKVVERKEESQITDLVYGNVQKVDLNTVFEAAFGGDAIALHILERAADYLAMAVAGVINLMDPDLVICEGKISRECSIFMEMFERALVRRRMKYIGREIRIIVSDTKSYTGAIGAASFVLEKFLQRGGEAQSYILAKKR